MKKHIKRLICYSLITLVSINFNIEARLPKYMAQRAAELLIKESKLGIKDKILDPEETKRENLLCLKDIKSLVKSNVPVGMDIKTKKIERIVNKILNDIKSKVTDKETFEKALLSSSIKNTLSEKIKAGVQKTGTETEKLNNIKKEIIEELKCFIYASKLVDFLYTTEKRQHLANWMKNRVYKGKVSDHFFLIKDEKETESFTRLFNDFDEGLIDDTYFREFANWHFPCWTGTLTCFMLKEPSLAQRIFQDKTWRNKGYNKEYLTEYSLMEMIHTEDLKNFSIKDCKDFIKKYNNYFKSPQKLIRILFLLELMDEWKNVQQVIGNDTISEPTLPNNYNYDPYECVPVPNTAYFLNAQQVKNDSERIKLQGSCMVSVIRNLLCILCRDENGEYKKNDSLRSEVDKYIRNFNDTKIRDFIPGTTSPAILGEFAENILPEIKVSYQPTLDLFVCTLNNLLKNKIESSKVVIPTPAEYMDGKKLEIFYQDLIETILRQITNHGKSLSTTIQKEWKTKNNNSWHNYTIAIEDEIVNKKVTIDIRKIGDGHHIEITDIKGMEKDENEILEK